MILHKDPATGATHDIQESAVLALLVKLGADTYYDTELVIPERCTKADITRIKRTLLQRHGHTLTDDEKALLDRAGQTELEHASWILQALTFGFRISVWADDASATQYRVTYRKSGWSKKSGNKTEHFEDEASLDTFIRRLRATRDLQYLHIQERPVGTWADNTRYHQWRHEDGLA